MFLVANAALVLTAALLVLLIASTEPRASRHAAGGGASADIPNGPTSQVVLPNQLEPTREPVALPPLIAAAGMQ